MVVLLPFTPVPQGPMRTHLVDEVNNSLKSRSSHFLLRQPTRIKRHTLDTTDRYGINKPHVKLAVNLHTYVSIVYFEKEKK